jgi:hypothetical protein
LNVIVANACQPRDQMNDVNGRWVSSWWPFFFSMFDAVATLHKLPNALL